MSPARHFLLIDNYDSFTYNLLHLVGLEAGIPQGAPTRVSVVRNDAMSVGEIASQKPDALIVSPGPCTPREAGICLDLIKALGATTPIFGVCLGHQAIGDAFGGTVIRAPTLFHGKRSAIHHNGQGLFHGINQSFAATRYHSLIVERETLPECLLADAYTDDGLIMALRHVHYPVYGVQFHPESIASEHGATLVKNFLRLVEDWHKKPHDKAA